jgi:hypothetical protein
VYQAVKTATKFVISAVIAVLVYTVASFIVLFQTGQNIEASLTMAYFSFWTAEIIALASIKNTKTKKGKKKKKQEETEDVDNNY